ncbi:hypothetical protein [Metabacillus malikii]|uniref:CBM6 domain-containing protein n=1 Tax=Metabacillus malikii TaxID=1504265 RepID=A0ABT9ZBI6_9BACI|nr:hypothetical protein [Metabacillus malikii]MDQ0228963.1 hypothetical protein [Metabacillus malikii]
MKKLLFTIGILAMYILSLHSPLSAIEAGKKQFFEVGSIINELENGIYSVQTKGEKPGEGIVYTPENGTFNTKPQFQVELKGSGEVLLKIEETNARGQFIKEVRVENITLTDDWKTYHINIDLETETSQIDFFVITETKENTHFSFKNVELN